MRIGKPHVQEKGKEIRYMVHAASDKEDRDLWFLFDQKFRGLLSDLNDAALVALLVPAMDAGEDIEIDGVISEKLYFNLARVQTILKLAMPHLRRIKVFPASVRTGKKLPAAGVGTGCSGGIDSFCVLGDYYYSKDTVGSGISYLFYNNVGSHGRGQSGEELFRKRLAHILPLTGKLGLPLIVTNSNLDAFYGKKTNIVLTATIRNAVLPLLFQEGIGRYLFASTFDYHTVLFRGLGFCDPAVADPVLLPLLSTEGLDFCSVGSEYTRVEKTLKISNIPDTYSFLDVCVNERYDRLRYMNCGACGKCYRALFIFEQEGLLEKYAAVFDLDMYKRKKLWFLSALLKNKEYPLNKELLSYAKEKGFSFPPPAYVLWFLRWLRLYR